MSIKRLWDRGITHKKSDILSKLRLESSSKPLGLKDPSSLNDFDTSVSLQNISKAEIITVNLESVGVMEKLET